MLSSARMKRGVMPLAAVLVVVGAALGARVPQTTERRASSFEIQEATIDRIQDAIRKKQITTRGVVEEYLRRIKAYNGTCVKEPQGILGPITTIAHAGQINALSTLNLRPSARAMWGFDPRKGRTLTSAADDAPSMPDALETADAQDRQFARTGRFVVRMSNVSFWPSRISTTRSTCVRRPAPMSTTPTTGRRKMRRS